MKMRNRKDIEKDRDRKNLFGCKPIDNKINLILEVLLDIRDLLKKGKQK